MKVFLAGGTGAIGRFLVPLLVRSGHQVVALTRSEEGAALMTKQGAEPVTGDALDTQSLKDLVVDARPDVIVNQLTAIPPRLHPRRIKEQMATTNRLRATTTPALVDAAKLAGARRVIAQSVAFFYDPDGGGIATEEDPLYRDPPAPFADMIRAVQMAERAVLRAEGVEGIVLRYGLMYGPLTFYAPDGSFAVDVMRNRIPLIGPGRGVFSFIHVADAAVATLFAVEMGQPGAYNVVDDEPVPVGEWLRWYAELIGARRPIRIPTWLGRLGGGPYAVYLMNETRGASNRKAKETLGWSLRFPSWRDGFAATFKMDEPEPAGDESPPPGT